MKGVAADELREARSQVAASYDERVIQLEKTLAEKDQLFARANETIKTLQTEIERVDLLLLGRDESLISANGRRFLDRGRRLLDEVLLLRTTAGQYGRQRAEAENRDA